MNDDITNDDITLDAETKNAQSCAQCGHPESDHRKGHCIGLKPEPPGTRRNPVTALPESALCECTTFVPKRRAEE